MQGYHKVRRFLIPAGLNELELDPGWKPFSAYDVKYGYTVVVARKWIRLGEDDELSEHTPVGQDNQEGVSS